MDFSTGIPTVKAAPELFAAFGEVFHQTMPTITGLRSAEVEQVRVAIMDGEGGHLDQERYHRPVFDRIFADREWSWPEFEEWRTIFAVADSWPPNWKRAARGPEASTLDVVGMCELFDVESIKAALLGLDLSVPAKSSKAALTKLAAASASPVAFASAAPGWPNVRREYEARRRAEVYALLMLTMSHRAKSLHERRRREALGLPPPKRLVYIWQEAKKHVKRVLAKNPDAVPPFYPGDLTV